MIGNRQSKEERDWLAKALPRLRAAYRQSPLNSYAEIATQMNLLGYPISTHAVGNWMRGDSTPNMFYCDGLCRVFRVSPTFIFTGDDPAKKMEQLLVRVIERMYESSGVEAKKKVDQLLADVNGDTS